MRSLLLLAILPFLGSTGDLSSRPADILRSRLMALDPSKLAGETLHLELFHPEPIQAVRESFVSRGPDGFTWLGHVRGDETTSIVLSVVRGSLSASIRLASAQYRIRPQAGPVGQVEKQGGLHRLEEVAPSSELSERLPLPSRATTGLPRVFDADDGSEIDLLVVYTPRARRRAGGVEAMASLVGLGVAEANLAFEKSEVSSRLRLVEIAEVPFVEAGRVESDLEILREGRDGALDEVHALRDAVHDVYIDPLVRRWVIRLVRATREAEGVAIGASVRGSLALERAA
ncbi:MAG TPA: hypothetical protein VIG29_07135, partial [Vicinamibacteria bacterium]